MGTRKFGSHLNFVHNDEIWKDHIRHEQQALRKWPDQWGLLTREYTRLNRRLIGDRLTPEDGDSAYPTRCPSFGDRSSRSPSLLSSSTAGSRKSTPGFSSTRLPSILGGAPATPQRAAGAQSPALPVISSANPAADRGLGRVWKAKAFPPTTAGEIGWQLAKTGGNNNLEIYGRYAPNSRGQHGILKLLNWPQQSIM